MKKRMKLFQRLFMPVLVLTLVLAGMFFQKAQPLEAAEPDYAATETERADEPEDNKTVKAPGKPDSLEITWKGGKEVDIAWEEASDATRYLVYRSFTSSSSGFNEIAEVEETSYTDEAASVGKTAYYKVIPYNDSVEGISSDVKSVYIVKAPAKVKATVSKNTVTVSFKASEKASGYEIWCKTGKNGDYKKAATLKSGKSVKKKFKNVKPGVYYYKVRAYRKNGSEKVYTDFGKTAKAKLAGSTIENTKSQLTIEADVKLTGTGTGYHAKLVMATPSSAVSFGIQYDAHAVAPYTGKAMALIENVASNDPGGQRYTRPGNKSLKLNKTYHLMMTVDKKGNGNVYLDYKKIGSFSQPNIAKEPCYLRIEAAARLNGDSVKATFSNIKCKWNGKYDSSKVLGKSLQWVDGKVFNHNAGLNYKYNKKSKNIQIFGTARGINGDWDSDYENVQYILQFQGPY